MGINQFAKIFVLIVAISVDAFTTAFTYGTENIKIPSKSIAVIHTINVAIIVVSMLLGFYLTNYLPLNLVRFTGFFILFIMGVVKLFDGIIKSALVKSNNFRKNISFSIMSLKFILSVYANPKTADADKSKTLSPKEAAVLAITLSADSLPIGIDMGLSSFPIWAAIITMLAADEFAIRSGNFLGKKASENIAPDFSWLGGALLIILSFTKLI